MNENRAGLRLRSIANRGDYMAAPKGNKNAVGNRGGAPKRNTNALKHGGYAKIFWEDLTPEENAMVRTMPTDLEELLIDQIKLLTVREYRIMKRIAYFNGIESGQVLSDVVRSEDKRQFADKEEKALYDERIAEKVEAGDRLPGHTSFGRSITADRIAPALLNV